MIMWLNFIRGIFGVLLYLFLVLYILLLYFMFSMMLCKLRLLIMIFCLVNYLYDVIKLGIFHLNNSFKVQYLYL